MMRHHPFAALLIYLLLFNLAVVSPSGGEALTPVVRICIADGKDYVTVTVKTNYRIYPADSEKPIMGGLFLHGRVIATKDGIQIGKRQIKLAGVRIDVSKGASIFVDQRPYRGQVLILKEDSKISAVNVIPLEEYLYGVLQHEVSHRWPIEAIKAQAIAARTFALYQAGENKRRNYDLGSDIYSQVYGGRASERWTSKRAVNLTRNKVLVYHGKLLPAYYHATCAGHTEDAARLWNIDLPPLKGVACDFCKDSPHYVWTKEMPLWELKNKLRDNGYKLEKIETVKILSRGESLRVDKLEVKDIAGTSVIVTAKDFRQMLGPNEIRSTNFEITLKWGQLIIDGFGWGHGVGMCQWGAYGMAKQGKAAEEILKYYYPGAEITTIDKL